MSFTGFSEEDLKRIKSSESGPKNEPEENVSNIKRIDKIGSIPKRAPQYKLAVIKNQTSDDAMDIAFDKCKLSLKPNVLIDNEIENDSNINNGNKVNYDNGMNDDNENDNNISEEIPTEINSVDELNGTSRKNSTSVTPDVVRHLDNYTEDELGAHRYKLEELQLRQKLMEEQNKKRKEMLAKALADRTKQTEEEVVRLEKIKKELQILDGQFSLDVAVLRKKIDQACLSYADAEKHYLRVEKEFLQAKINLQKEKEKKELLTEHLCALITHNETRKAQKLETLMLELATDKNKIVQQMSSTPDIDTPVIIDGVDERTGKMVEILPES